MYTIATVHFQARAVDELRDALMASADRAGVPWWLACKVAARLMLAACRAAATAQMTAMTEWTAEQWSVQDELRGQVH